MTVPYSVSTNDIVAAADVNQYKNLLEGASGYTATYALKSTAGTNFTVTLGDTAGSNKLSIKDSAGVEVAYIDSDGAFHGVISLASGTLILPQSATPVQTTEGSISWDTDDNRITVGDGAATKLFYPTTGQLYVPVYNYKAATQVFTTSTVYADVTGAVGATFGFPIAANEVWKARWYILLSFGGTGGAKFQVTGPAAASTVSLYPTATYNQTASGGAIYTTLVTGGNQTSFSAGILGLDSEAGAVTVNRYNSNWSSMFSVEALIVNGANAGTVTLQAAQQSSNSTTTLGIGSFMRAERWA